MLFAWLMMPSMMLPSVMPSTISESQKPSTPTAVNQNEMRTSFRFQIGLPSRRGRM